MTPIYRTRCPEFDSPDIIRGRVVDIRPDSMIIHCDRRHIRVYGYQKNNIRRGDIIAVRWKSSGGLLHYENHEILVRPAEDPSCIKDSIYQRLSRKRATLESRNTMLRTIRRFFDDRGFMEMNTPTLVPSPGLEPTLGFFSTAYVDDCGKTYPYTLPTSPEFALKKVLAAGYDLIYEIKQVFRNRGECGAAHNPEFTMLEWYRAYADYTVIMHDIEELVYAIARELNPTMTSSFRGCTISWEPPYKRISMCELWRDVLHADLEIALTEPGGLEKVYSNLNASPVPEAESAMDLFHRIMIDHIEPKLSRNRPVIIYDYPSELAALSVIRSDNHIFCERFELYVGGIEMANAFSELNDPREMALRIRKDRREQTTNGLPVMPADGELLRAIRQGMPPAAGIAMGLDRMLMALLGIDSIHECMPFPFDSACGNEHRLSSLL